MSRHKEIERSMATLQRMIDGNEHDLLFDPAGQGSGAESCGEKGDWRLSRPSDTNT